MKKCSIPDCENKLYLKGLCNAHYLRLRRHGDPMIKKSKWNEPLDFVVTEKCCFEVISHKPGVHGYPQVRHKHRPSPAHRKVYEEMFGEIPKGLQVRHKCDNRLCINPEHLELGTFRDNMMDKLKRNRHAKGETNGHAKLKEKQVVEIRLMINQGFKNVEIAKKFKVAPSTILDIKKSRTWCHVKIDRQDMISRFTEREAKEMEEDIQQWLKANQQIK